MADEIRMKKIVSFFREELNRLVTTEFSDPVFDNAFVSFPEIKVSRDMSVAHVNVSVLGDDELREKIVEILNGSSVFIRGEIRKISSLRKIPSFVFHADKSIETAAMIDGIISNLEIPPDEEPAEETD
ncbi:MAG TPA: 30S ribosome-binding factor RbfA, partial [bacterium]|jgi:ribosome-binding factor A